MKPASAKNKGRKWQQNCAALITRVFVLDEGDVVSRPMGSGGADLMMSPAARKVFPFTLECKKTTGPPGMPAMNQAKHNAFKGTLGAVAWQPRGIGGESGMITFDLEEFVNWFKLDTTEMNHLDNWYNAKISETEINMKLLHEAFCLLYEKRFKNKENK